MQDTHNTTNGQDEPFIRNYGPGPIGVYSNGGGHFSGFYFERHFRQDPREAQPPIAPTILARFSPEPDYQQACEDGRAFATVRSDMVLPRAAPGDILDIRALLERFDASQPLKSDIMATIKIILCESEPAHAGWERVRVTIVSTLWSSMTVSSASTLSIIHSPSLSQRPR